MGRSPIGGGRLDGYSRQIQGQYKIAAKSCGPMTGRNVPIATPAQGRMTMKRLLIIGAGFAGMYAATSAARLRNLQGVPADELEIALLAPEPFLVIRPRLYEANPETMKAPLTELFQAVDVRYVQGMAETIDTASGSVAFTGTDGRRHSLTYDRL